MLFKLFEKELDLALNNLQRLIFHKIQPTNQVFRIQFLFLSISSSFFQKGISIFIGIKINVWDFI